VRRSGRGSATLLLAGILLAACGKKGPPLPPLVRLPAAPAEIAADRRSDQVEIRFVVPAANTDGSRPANIERVDVYGFSGAAAISDDELLELGTRIGSVEVKAPRDPDDTIEPDEPDSFMQEPEGSGLDQGSAAHVTERLEPPQRDAATAAASLRAAQSVRPDFVSPFSVPSRVYAAVGVNTSGRRGPWSSRVSIPLVPPPPPPADARVTFDERRIMLRWTAAGTEAPASPGDVLPARPVGAMQPKRAYHVYELALSRPDRDAGAAPAPATEPARPAAPAASPNGPASPTPSPAGSAGGQPGSSAADRGAGALVERRLTKAPIDAYEYADDRIEWGVERCYQITTVHVYDALSIESAPAPPQCVTLVDTFAPAPPAGLRAIESDGSITLIWEPSPESDLAGYTVLRGAPGAPELTPVTKETIPSTQYTDAVPAGTRYVYAVTAVDRSGNASGPSPRVEAAAR
jgi:hypothetical protein